MPDYKVESSPGKWPKPFPPLTPEQMRIRDDFMREWHEILPHRYSVVERFNHGYAANAIPLVHRCRTLEIGAGLGEHLNYENLADQDYYCLELRQNMAEEITRKFPSVNTTIGDCQNKLDFESGYFDRILAIHVLEHLRNLPAAIDEMSRLLAPDGHLIVVIPCDPGLAYEFARKISAERIFRKRYRQSYRWLIESEHINSPKEILDELSRRFSLGQHVYFPLRIPIITINLCLGLVARHRTQ